MEKAYLIQDWDNSPFEFWARNFCNKNQWRVTVMIGDYEDCLSECKLQYVLCRKRYGAVVNSPKHFMRLFQIMVVTTFHTLSLKDFRTREALTKATEKKQSELIESDAMLVCKLNSCSDELRQVLDIFFKCPQELFEVLKSESEKPKHVFSKVMEHLGISKDKTIILQTELKQLLS